MGPLLDLLKHFKLGRSPVFAVFIALIGYLVGRRYWPNDIDPLPAGWTWVPPILVMALGVQIAVWMVTPLYASIKAARTDRRARKAYFESPLNEAESQVLYCIAKSNAREVNLYLAAERAQLPFSDTELLAIANRLSARRILSIPALSGANVVLTDAGRRRAGSVVQRIDAMIAAELQVGDRVRHINTGQEMVVANKTAHIGKAFQYGHPVFCEWDQKGGPRVGTFQQGVLERLPPANDES